MVAPSAPSPENVSCGENVPPVVETSRLRLRPWRDTDAPEPGEGPDAASLRFMPAGAQPGADDFTAWLSRRRKEMAGGADLHWCIADLATDQMLGNVQIFRMGPAQGRFQGELGYWLRPGARGRGVISEAVAVAVAHAFRPVTGGGLGLVRLHAGTDSDNHASQSILQSAGFIQWGTDHQAWRRTDGSLADGVYFELLADEWRADGLTAGSGRHHARSPGSLGPSRLEAGRVQLRPWSDEDLPRLVEGLTDWMSHPVDESEARQWLARRRQHRRGRLPPQVGRIVSWCIADRPGDRAVGSIDAFDIGGPLLPGGCELGYWTHPDSRGKGLMTEALRRLLPHLLGSSESGGLGLRRVTARTSELNIASQSVMRAAGMRQWGSAPRASIAPDGRAVSQLHFAVLADERDAVG